ncbi:MAG: DUF1015 family protein [Clostridiales Family XIII bacterium]|jgi:uncharacterized protein (DUF1015 family)|nr:DUF1015 family protein [Clostridiales Family XIII bacterium]
MTRVKPFKALRPAAGFEKQVAALPYDVMTSAEARAMAVDAPYSFLHIDKAEIDLDEGIDPYDAAVYARAKENLDRMTADGIFIQDPKPRFYIYMLTMDGKSQAGLVGCPSIDDYLSGSIKKHELTRAEKEADRIRHVDVLDANTGPIFLTCRPQMELSAAMQECMDNSEPLYDFVSDDGIGHKIWVVEGNAVAVIEKIFNDIDALYIADGHHRCASAVRVGMKRREENPAFGGEEEYNSFLAVIFPSDQLRILDYNRVVRDLAGLSADEFIEKLKEAFEVSEYVGEDLPGPRRKHEFSLFLEEKWYVLTAKSGTWDDSDPVSRLDVSILQNNVFAPILGINDPRTDSRIDFVGGIRGLAELEARTRSDMKAAFALYPTTMDDLMDIADAGLIMPPKSTWFEPKLRSGLLIHKLK